MAANPELEQPELMQEHRLPFAFAKHHGVLIKGTKDGRTEVIYRRGVSTLSLAEIRRFVGGPV